MVTEFYRKNTGFFFVLFGFGLGVLRNVEHYYIIIAAIHSYSLLGGLALLWTLYLIKTISFTLQALSEKQNQFLYQFFLYPFRFKIAGFVLVHLLQFLPVLVYIGAIIGLGMLHQRWLSVGICLLYLLLTGLVAVRRYARQLTYPGRESRLLAWLAVLSYRLKKPQVSLFLFKVLHDHKLLFLLTKILSGLLLFLVARLYEMGGYDNRLVMFALTLAGLANVVLVYYFHYFENVDLSLQKNLPLRLRQRFLRHMLTLSCLLLPEMFLFGQYFHAHFHILRLLEGFLLVLSISLLIYSYLFIQSIKVEILVRRVFLLMLLYFFLILFGLPIGALVLLNGGLAYFIYLRFYYSFELYIPSQDEEE